MPRARGHGPPRRRRQFRVVGRLVRHLPGLGQGRTTVARAINLLRRQTQDAEVRVVEVLANKDGKAVGYVDGPLTSA